MVVDTLNSFARCCADRFVVMAAPENNGVAILSAIASEPWEVVSQEGATLSERLAHGFRTLMQDGKAGILVGSDSPQVPIESIDRALEKFRSPGRALMGRCSDGGYYLIGLTSLQVGVFRDIPWSTSEVAAITRQRCTELGLELEELPGAYDVDHLQDLRRLQKDLRREPGRAPQTAAMLATLDLGRESSVS